MKQLPNVITFLRIPFSIAMLVVPPFSVLFWIFYLGSGLTDILDGLLAKKLHLESAFGARLDSTHSLLSVRIAVYGDYSLCCFQRFSL